MIPRERHNEPAVIDAKTAELGNWRHLEAVGLVDDKGQKVISTRWVITEKEVDGVTKIKARLVIRGFEEEEEVQADAPTAAKTTLRIALAMTANNNWPIETIDIKAAFLQGRPIERDVYITPPSEAEISGKIWRLRKTAYGLIDAARNWFLSVKETLTELGCKQSHLDKAVFRWYHKNMLEGIILLHVDDFFVSGNERFIEAVVQIVCIKFQVGKKKQGNFKYVGLNISKTSEV